MRKARKLMARLAALAAVAVGAAILLVACGALGPAVEYVAENRLLREAFPGCGDAETPEALCESADAAFVVDLHSDSLMWGRDMRTRWSYGHTDFERLGLGGTDIQIFGVPTHTPIPMSLPGDRKCASRDALDTSDLVTLFNATLRTGAYDPRGRAYLQAARFQKWTASPEPHVVRPIYTRADLGVDARGRPTEERAGLRVMLSVEGIHWLEADDEEDAVRDEIRRLWGAGYRMMALTHRFTNGLGAGSEDCALLEEGSDPGLTDAGKAAIEAMIERGVMIDLAHASNATIKGVTDRLAEIAPEARPALFMSHGGIAAACPKEEYRDRNLSPEAVRQIVAAGGVIGIGYWPQALCYDWNPSATLAEREKIVFDAAARHFLAVVDAVETAPASYWQTFGHADGAAPDPLDHIALGSDFDGAVQVPGDATAVVPRFARYLGAFSCDDAFRSTLPPGFRDRCPLDATPFAGAEARILGENAARALYRGLPD